MPRVRSALFVHAQTADTAKFDAIKTKLEVQRVAGMRTNETEMRTTLDAVKRKLEIAEQQAAVDRNTSQTTATRWYFCGILFSGVR